ncbi:MAG: RDD family protein [Nitrososphaerales archaeon]
MVEESEEDIKEKNFFEALDHDVRRWILLQLYDKIELSYTDILNILKIGEGTLNFHLKKLSGFLQRTEKGTYILSPKGKIAVEIIYKVKKAEQISSSLLVKKPLLSRELVMRRIAAFLIDALIFFIFSGVFFDPILLNTLQESILHFSKIYEFHPWLFHPEHIPMIGEIIFRMVELYAHIFFAIYIFITLIEAYKGQTPGKYIMKIRVIKISGEKIGILESGIRNAGKIFLLPLDLIIGIFYYRKGFIRFFDYYIEAMIESIKRA